MEEPQQTDQPTDTQPDGDVEHNAAVTCQPAHAQQRTSAPVAEHPESKEAVKDHLTVISDNMETSKYTVPVSCFSLQSDPP